MSKKSNNCGPGEIKKKGFKRKEYQRKDGVVVPATNVPPTCIRDVGKPGKGPKTLPKPGDKIHLTNFGYGIHKPTNERRRALRKASQKYGILPVSQRLNLLRNFQYIPENKEIFSRDVEFMKKMYEPFRKSPIRQSSNNRSKSENQRGGDTLFQDPLTSSETDTSETSDIVIDNIELPERRVVEVNIIDRQKVCDSEGVCGVRNIVYEEHTVDGKKVVFYTLGEKDVDGILVLDKKYLDSDSDKNSTRQKITDNRGLLIGIKVDNVLEGYTQYEPLENLETKIVWFCANKGFGTPLYTFLEKYFKMNDYTRIIITVSIEGSYATRRINFWYGMGFSVYETSPIEKKVQMEKNI